jgi:hypothetical protein
VRQSRKNTPLNCILHPTHSKENKCTDEDDGGELINSKVQAIRGLENIIPALIPRLLNSIQSLNALLNNSQSPGNFGGNQQWQV